MKKTRSTSEALRLLEDKRAWLISLARRVAIELCKRDGSSNSHAVLVEMRSRGMLDGYTKKHHWTGNIFTTKEMFVKTGEVVSYSDRKGDRNVHERTVHLWKLVDSRIDASMVELPCRPPTPPKDERCPQMAMPFAPRHDFLTPTPKNPAGEPSK